MSVKDRFRRFGESIKRRNRAIWERIGKLAMRLTPPGVDWEGEVRWVRTGIRAASVISGLIFAGWFIMAYSALYYPLGQYFVSEDGSRVLTGLREGAVMPDFVSVAPAMMVSFLVLVLIMMLLIVYHCLYYWQDSKSIYLMRRLPDRFELHRRSFAWPLIAAALCLCAAIPLILLCLILYLLITPRACLLPDQLWKLLNLARWIH